ncbi:MAG: ion transporter [Chitinophagaceae bacterium]
MYQEIKRKVYTLLHPELGETRWDKLVNTAIILLIVLNVVAVILETVPSIYEPYQHFFDNFDLFSVVVFSIEYVLRVWSSNCDPKYKHSVYGRLRYMVSWGALIDLLAIIPIYLHTILNFDLRVLRIMRLMRFFRLFRLTAYMQSAKLVTNVFKSRANELVLSLVLVLFLFIISSCVMYFVEHPMQPEAFSSIPATMWWSIVSLTTVGYGDMRPITDLGKILTGVMLLIGVALLALPAGIITAGFLEELRLIKNPKPKNCPHCGKPLDHYDHH